MNQKIGVFPFGPEGKFGSVEVSMVDGQLVASVKLSPKALLDEAALKVGGPIPAEVAAFLENAIGLK